MDQRRLAGRYQSTEMRNVEVRGEEVRRVWTSNLLGAGREIALRCSFAIEPAITWIRERKMAGVEER